MLRKKRIALVLTLFMTLVFTQSALAAHWADESLAYVQENQLLPSGYSATQVAERLDDPINRGDLTALLIHGLKINVEGKTLSENIFVDDETIAPALRPYLSVAFDLAIFQGKSTPEGRIADVNQSITREEAATIISRALGMTVTGNTEFTDDGKIATWAKISVNGMGKSALIAGNDQNQFLPQAPMTWGEIVGILHSAHQNNKLVTPTIKILAGNGEATHINGASEQSGVFMPMGLSQDIDGKIYFADSGNNLIRSINKSVIADYSGVMGPKDSYNRVLGGYLDGSKEKAVFNRPSDVQVTASGILVADTENNTIRLIKEQAVYTYAGSPKAGHQDGDRKTALFNQPSALATDNQGNVYISDTENQVIRQIAPNGMVTTIAGTVGKAGFADGSAKDALLCQPMGLAYHNGGLYIADSGNQRIRLLKNGVMSTVAGSGLETYDDSPFIVGGFQDGNPQKARFNNPRDLAFGKDGTLYITDMDNGMIRVYNNQKVSTLIGFGQAINYQGLAIEETLVQPSGLTVLDNELIITDSFTHYIMGIKLK